MDQALAVQEVVSAHQNVRTVRLVGSRAEGSAHELSDWDFVVETDDFASLAPDLHELVLPLRPLAEQWDRYSDYACYMLVLRGPTKIDLIFPSERQEWAPAWEASPETLEAIDVHFWDWMLWLEQKRLGGRKAQYEKSLGDLFELLLRPLGVPRRPRSISETVELYVAARRALEQRFGIRVPRELELEVRPVLGR